MPILFIYLDKEYKNKSEKYDLTEIISFSHQKIIDIIDIYKKIKKINDFELGIFGDKLYDIMIKYKIHEFNCNNYNLTNVDIPYDFNVKILLQFLFFKKYKELLIYLNNYISNMYKELRIDDEETYRQFYDFIYKITRDLNNYLEKKMYYNKELDHYIKNTDYDKLREFTYTILKLSDCSRHAIFNTDLDVD